MRVRFGYTVDVSDDQRRVIAAYNDDNHEGLDNVAGGARLARKSPTFSPLWATRMGSA